jgi:hypothetical protein
MLLFFTIQIIPIYRDVKRREKDMIDKIKSVLNVSHLILSITINTNIFSYYQISNNIF